MTDSFAGHLWTIAHRRRSVPAWHARPRRVRARPCAPPRAVLLALPPPPRDDDFLEYVCIRTYARTEERVGI
jgi:hypothetical protein